MKLPIKQQRFCDEYLIDLNATQAAIRAGYSPRTANEQASRMLAKANIQEYIQELRQKIADKLEISREKVVAEYAKIAFHDIRELFDDDSRLKAIKSISADVAAAIASVEVEELKGGVLPIGETKKLKMWDKIKALDGLSRVLGLNAPEKLDLTTKGDKIKQTIIKTSDGTTVTL